jgi:hypothetical protein
MPALSTRSAVAVSFQRQQTWARLFSVNCFSLPVGCSNCRPSHVVASRKSRLAESHEITGPALLWNPADVFGGGARRNLLSKHFSSSQ